MDPHWQSTEGSSGVWSAPGASSAAYAPERSPRRISQLVVLLLALGIVVDLASMVHEVSGLSLLDRFLSGAVDEADLSAWDTLFARVALLQLVVFLVTAAAWLAWQFRIVASVLPLGLEQPPAKPAMSIVWWFVPFANLVMVYRIYRHLLETFGGRFANTPLVGAWWVMYLTSSVVANFASQNWARSIDTVKEFEDGLVYWIVADALTIASAALAILLVRRIQAGQNSAVDGRRDWQVTAPDWTTAPDSSPMGESDPRVHPFDGPPPDGPARV